MQTLAIIAAISAADAFVEIFNDWLKPA